MSDVVDFPGKDLVLPGRAPRVRVIEPAAVTEGLVGVAPHLEQLLVIGVTKDGSLYAATSHPDIADSLLLIERFKRRVMDGTFGEDPFVHQIELGPWPVGMFVITTKAAYHRFWRDRCGDFGDRHPYPRPDAAHCQKLVDEKTGGCMFIIVLGPQRHRDELAATLAHEATHAMRWLFEHLGEEAPGTEAQAYLVEHIVRGGLEAIPRDVH